jgi:hypothetical protein
MEMSASRLIPASPDKVWQALNDPETLKACIPGCESFTRESDTRWRTMVLAKVGPVSARFAGLIELEDVVPPTGYTLRFNGEGGAAGFARGEAQVALSPAEGGQTSLAYTAKAQIGGKLAQIGSRLVDGVAAKLADDFFARFAARFAPPPAAETASPSPIPAAPSMKRFVILAAIVAALSLFALWCAR